MRQAKIAEKQGADYLGVGLIFSTTSKEIDRPLGTEFIKEIKEAVKIPFFPIGGVNHNNVEEVIKAGASGVAVISAVISAEDITQAAKSLLETIQSHKGSATRQ